MNLFLLFHENGNVLPSERCQEPCGVYSSLKEVSKAILDRFDYDSSYGVLPLYNFLEWELNYSPEASGWDYIYHPKQLSDLKKSLQGFDKDIYINQAYNVLHLDNEGIMLYDDFTKVFPDVIDSEQGKIDGPSNLIKPIANWLINEIDKMITYQKEIT